MNKDLQRLLKDIDCSAHVMVLGLLAIGSSAYDNQAPLRDWAREFLSRPISVGTTVYTVNVVNEKIEGAFYPCLVLTKSENHFDLDKAKTTNYTIPVEALREVNFTLRVLDKSLIPAAA